MTPFGLRLTDLQTIIQVVSDFPQIEQLIIFGSRAKGTFKQGSDVDLALKGNGIDLKTTLKIGSILNEETAMPYFFDVLDYDAIENNELRDHIDRVGTILMPAPAIFPQETRPG